MKGIRKGNRQSGPRSYRDITIATALILIGVGFSIYRFVVTPRLLLGDPSEPALLVDGKAKTAPEEDPKALVRRVIERYRNTPRYRDEGKIQVSYRVNREFVSNDWPCAVSFERPGKMRIQAYQAELSSNSDVADHGFQAVIRDPESKNLDGQSVKRAPPKEMKLDTLSEDPILLAQLASRLNRTPPQIELLLAEKAFESLFNTERPWVEDAKESFEDRECRRIVIATPEGTYRLWVDEKDELIRQIDLPATLLLPDLAADNQVSELAVSVKLFQAGMPATPFSAETFELKRPENAKVVQYFVLPPPQLVSPNLGKKLSGYRFRNLKGESEGGFQESDQSGRPIAMFWFSTHPACESAVKEFVAFANDYLANHRDVALLAVCTDPSATTSSSIMKFVGQTPEGLTLVRDLEAFGESLFKIDAVPSLLVLGKQGEVQFHSPLQESGFGLRTGVILDRILRGEDVAAELISKQEEMKKEYQDAIARGGMRDKPENERPAYPSAAPLTTRRQQRVWVNEQLEGPGNLAVVSSPGDTFRVIAVCSNGQGLAVLDSAGAVVSKHDLKLPDGTSIESIRVWGSQAEILVAAFTQGGDRVFVFDHEFKLVLSYPDEGQSDRSSIRDVSWFPTSDSSGPSLAIGFDGAAGIHLVDLHGKMKWRNRSVDPLDGLAVDIDEAGDARLIAVGKGAFTPINRFGNPEPEIRVTPWYPLRLLPSKTASFLALSPGAKSEPIAVCLSQDWKELWSFPLPEGEFEAPVQWATTGALISQGEEKGKEDWIIAGPDGSLHILSEDGETSDFMQFGEGIRGFGVIGGANPLLVVSHGQVVEAFSIDKTNRE